MPVRSRCGDYDFGTICKRGNLLKMVQNLEGPAHTHYLQSWNGHHGAGTGRYWYDA